ncbi:MAG: thioesterase [Bacillota bacterium]|nr:thioesterase [Bacillota bacterium]
MQSPTTGPDSARSWQFAVRNVDTDPWDRLDVAALISMMQEAATFDALKLELGYVQLDPLNLRWLVSRISLRLDENFRWRDTVNIRTWCNHITHLYFDRQFRFERSDGTVVGVANSAWFLAEQDSHRPRRPDTLGDLEALGYTSGPWKPAIEAEKLRFRLARPDNEEAVLRYTPGLSDQDRNGHVNHTRYAAWSLDALWARLGRERRTPVSWRRFDINFLAEVGLYDEVLLFAETAGEGELPLIVVGRLADGREAFRARFS